MKTVIVFRTGALGTWREKYNGIATHARKAGWQLKPVDVRMTHPDYGMLLDYWKPDGVIFDASGNPKMYDDASLGTIPVVVMNPEGEIGGRRCASVSSDSAKITRLAVSELLELNPVSLAFVEWFDPSIAWSKTKRTEIEKIAAMHGLPLKVITPEADEAENPAALEERIAKAMDKMPLPCGFFTVTDMIGAAAVAAANRLDMRIPDDIAIVSVDDDPEICENCSPTLSSVRPDFHKLGMSAALLLDDVISGNCASAAKIVVPPLELIHRASTRATAKYDRKVREALEAIRLGACKGMTPKQVSSAFGLSRRMVEMRFKAATGKTIGEAILDERLSVACSYLREGRTSVSAIANFCGWNSDIAFRKAFISRFGMPPRKWQKTSASDM